MIRKSLQEKVKDVTLSFPHWRAPHQLHCAADRAALHSSMICHLAHDDSAVTLREVLEFIIGNDAVAAAKEKNNNRSLH